MHTNCAKTSLYLHVSYEADDSAANVPLDDIACAAIETYFGTKYIEEMAPAKMEEPRPYAVQFIGTCYVSRVYDVFYADPASPGANYVATVAIRKIYGYRESNIHYDAIVYDRRVVAVPTFRALSKVAA